MTRVVGGAFTPDAAPIWSFNPEPTAKVSGDSRPMRVPTVPAELDAFARSAFAVGSGLNDLNVLPPRA